jgi:hypothetical protein
MRTFYTVLVDPPGVLVPPTQTGTTVSVEPEPPGVPVRGTISTVGPV